MLKKHSRYLFTGTFLLLGSLAFGRHAQAMAIEDGRLENALIESSASPAEVLNMPFAFISEKEAEKAEKLKIAREKLEEEKKIQEEKEAEERRQQEMAEAEKKANDRSAILEEAKKYIGTPYVWGGKTPAGFDCSGFTSYVYRQVYGIELGSYTVPQETSGETIDIAQAKPGDLLFWGGHGGSYHVAISMGEGQYIHAPESGDVVRIAPIDPYFTPDFAVHVSV